MKNLENLNKEELEEIAVSLDALEKKKKESKLDFYLPDKGLLRRELYPNHEKFINFSGKARQGIFIAANRTGKTMAGAAMLTYHLTGLYPHWYKGKRWTRGIKSWAVGKDSKTARDIIQYELLGQKGQYGTGMIPKDLIIDTPTKPGTPAAVEMIYVKHVSGDVSTVTFKSYDQGFDSFVGTHMDVVWFDEEVPTDIYTECLVRTMRVDKFDDESEGIVYLTFTPDRGITELVESFMKDGTSELEKGLGKHRFLTMIGWDDVPHLSEEEKEMMREEILRKTPHLFDAKTKGLPTVGTGAIYPISDDICVCDPFEIPNYYEFGYSMDSSHRGRATLWFAIDPVSDVMYIYDEYFASGVPAHMHAASVTTRNRGDWIDGVIDPAAEKDISNEDGRNLLEMFLRLGLRLQTANNALESGLSETRYKLEAGKLKIFSTCARLVQEKHFYRRDERGNIVNKHKYHLLDCLRYAVMSGKYIAQSEVEMMFKDSLVEKHEHTGRDTITGY